MTAEHVAPEGITGIIVLILPPTVANRIRLPRMMEKIMAMGE
jgi:hypothetical protein